MTTYEEPIYISLTSIFKNQEILLKTLQSVLNQTKLPNKVFLYLSEEPHILDTGFTNKEITNKNLLEFINNQPIIDIKWVENIGSYRKLLPLLKEKWNEECIIITIDDDLFMDKNSIANLISDYSKHKCVISYRGFTPIYDSFEKFNYLNRGTLVNSSLYNFSTNGAGTLWKPTFFHNTGELIFDKNIYMNYCDKQDDIWFYLVRILNKINCYIDNKTWGTLDHRSNGLFLHFNSKNNINTIVFRNTLKKLKELNYNF